MILPFRTAQTLALEDLARLWQPAHPFVLIGAAAIGCHRANPRATRDLDLVLAVSMEELPAGLDRLPGWSRHPTKEHEWRGPGDVSVDVLPAGPDLLAAGFLEWPSGRRMSMTGLRHAFTRCVPLRLTEGTTLSLASLEVLALLKIVSYLDRPAEREHDLGDLGLVMNEYLPADDDRRWTDEMVDMQLPFEQVGAYALGRDMAAFMNADERECVASLLQRLRDGRGPTRGLMLRLAPAAWRTSEEEVMAQFDALARGLGM